MVLNPTNSFVTQNLPFPSCTTDLFWVVAEESNVVVRLTSSQILDHDVLALPLLLKPSSLDLSTLLQKEAQEKDGQLSFIMRASSIINLRL